MYSTGAIGLWSVIELGIAIIAGSLPALRPLLSLAIFGHSSSGESSGPHYPSRFGNTKNTRRSRNGHHPLVSGVKMDTLQRINSVDGEDAESQRHILKQTEVSVTSNARLTTPDTWEKTQVLGFKPKNKHQEE